MKLCKYTTEVMQIHILFVNKMSMMYDVVMCNYSIEGPLQKPNGIPLITFESSSSYCSSALCSSHVHTWLEYGRAWSVASSGWCCAGVGDNKT